MQGIDVVGVDRGGKVTYHGPGQLVGYPIVAIDDVMAFVGALEQAVVRRWPTRAYPARAGAPPTGATTPACGSRTARSPRSACTSRAA